MGGSILRPWDLVEDNFFEAVWELWNFVTVLGGSVSLARGPYLLKCTKREWKCWGCRNYVQVTIFGKETSFKHNPWRLPWFSRLAICAAGRALARSMYAAHVLPMHDTFSYLHVPFTSPYIVAQFLRSANKKIDSTHFNMNSHLHRTLA